MYIPEFLYCGVCISVVCISAVYLYLREIMTQEENASLYNTKARGAIANNSKTSFLVNNTIMQQLLVRVSYLANEIEYPDSLRSFIVTGENFLTFYYVVTFCTGKHLRFILYIYRTFIFNIFPLQT